MDYPQDFPAESRAKVEAARIRAGRKFDVKSKRRYRRGGRLGQIPTVAEREAIFWNYAVTPFLVFAEEAYRLRLWPADEMRQRCEEFLRRSVIDAYYRKGRGIVRDPVSNLNGSILWEAQQGIEKLSQWRKYENLFLKLAGESPVVSFHAGLIERNRHLLAGVPPRKFQPSTAPGSESKPAKASGGNTREAVLRPMLRTKGYSVHDWAKSAKVDFHTANRYLKGTIKPHVSTLKKLADALGVEVDKLPA